MIESEFLGSDRNYDWATTWVDILLARLPAEDANLRVGVHGGDGPRMGTGWSHGWSSFARTLLLVLFVQAMSSVRKLSTQALHSRRILKPSANVDLEIDKPGRDLAK